MNFSMVILVVQWTLVVGFHIPRDNSRPLSRRNHKPRDDSSEAIPLYFDGDTTSSLSAQASTSLSPQDAIQFSNLASTTSFVLHKVDAREPVWVFPSPDVKPEPNLDHDPMPSMSSSSKSIVSMTFPLLLVWLAAPMMSLIDTSVVGLTSGVFEQAALGPSTALCDVGLYVFNFLGIVTTQRVAARLVVGDNAAASRSVEDGVLVATILGVAIGAALLSKLGPIALGVFTKAGGGSADAYFHIALKYVRIRALGLVSLLISISQPPLFNL